ANEVSCDRSSNLAGVSDSSPRGFAVHSGGCCTGARTESGEQADVEPSQRQRAPHSGYLLRALHERSTSSRNAVPRPRVFDLVILSGGIEFSFRQLVERDSHLTSAELARS